MLVSKATVGPDVAHREEKNVADKIYKLVELVGTSTETYEKAIQNAIEKASRTLHNLDWFEVTEMRGRVENGAVAQFQVKLKVGFRLD